MWSQYEASNSQKWAKIGLFQGLFSREPVLTMVTKCKGCLNTTQLGFGIICEAL